MTKVKFYGLFIGMLFNIPNIYTDHLTTRITPLSITTAISVTQFQPKTDESTAEDKNIGGVGKQILAQFYHENGVKQISFPATVTLTKQELKYRQDGSPYYTKTEISSPALVVATTTFNLRTKTCNTTFRIHSFQAVKGFPTSLPTYFIYKGTVMFTEDSYLVNCPSSGT